MAHGPDLYSDSDDSLLGDDGDYYDFKDRLKSNKTLSEPPELTEEEKKREERLDFFDAVSYGYIEVIQELLSRGFDVNTDLREGWTGLMLAASYGNPEVTKLLIDSGANVNQDRDAVTPLMMACSCPDYNSPFDRSLEAIKLLVEHGASVQAINRKRMDALMYAASNGNLLAVEYLLPNADKSAMDNQRWNAFTWAVSNNQVEVVEFLMDKGFDMQLTDVRGNTPLDIAKEYGFDDIINLFPKKDDDLVAEILARPALSFEDTFKGLNNNERPAFFEDICNFLLSVKCGHLIPVFLEKNVTLGQFLAMDEGDLKQIGVLLPYQRNRILTGLHRFHKEPYHPKSLHICVKNDTFSNVDVAIEIMSAVKQVICMEAGLKYLEKHLKKEPLSDEDRAMVAKNISEIKTKIGKLKAVTHKLERRSLVWDATATPADLITKNSIKGHFPWRKISVCLGLFTLVLFCKLRKVI